MLSFILIVIACVTSTRGQEGDIEAPDNKTQCVNQLVQWCNNTQYPQQGVGMVILSMDYRDSSGYYRVFCSADWDGTNCTRNGESWFTCTPDHVVTYKGQVLTDSSANVDDDICATVEKAFNDLLIQKLSRGNTTMTQMGTMMEEFFEEMAAMADRMRRIHHTLFGNREEDPELPFMVLWDRPWSHPPRTDSVTEFPDDKQDSPTEQANQIERE